MRTNRASETEVMMAPTPGMTTSWSPLAHGDLIRVLDKSVDAHGLRVVNKDYSLDESGLNVFGAWTLDQGDRDQSLQLGFRNSNNKAMALALVAGNTIMVCSNMCISGKWLEFHKHTSGLDIDRVQELATRAVGDLIPQLSAFADWRKSLNQHYLSAPERKEFVFDLIANGIISGSQFANFHKALEEECDIRKGSNLDGCPGSLGNLYEAVTRLMRGWNMLRASQAMAKLSNQTEGYLALKAEN